ncbi:hypothetical protein BCU68_15640 [Vibrio sp. 10N.286.49.B3]|uniref:hypothetical protein n=1 Tax=Vibrio sp. 10N.286.49.B3 TaxID=1880855 RepID=UPI000C84B3AE|nr:hypothetical protein [Vibrio sp. 10N.286.49.B3]PMH41391.1 hypothetical protein BCU68_15640 [Vibrio sp. 10N.286.49.B3]
MTLNLPSYSSVLLILPLLISNSLFANTGTAIILPSQHELSQDMQGNQMTAKQVIDWEVKHSDIIFGAYTNRKTNQQTNTTGYMYNQKLDVNNGELENDIRNFAQLNEVDFEDFFLHFSEDTILAEVNKAHGENTLLNRKPMIAGYTTDINHAGFRLYKPTPWKADVFAHSKQGGALYIYHSEMFDQVELQFSHASPNGTLSIEYPAAIDSKGRVSQWRRFNIQDQTTGITKRHSLTWQLPSDWKRASTHDGSGRSYGGGQYFGSTFLRDGARLYVIKIHWNNANTTHRPQLNNILLHHNFPVIKDSDLPNLVTSKADTADGKEIQQWRKIRGFDRSADRNHDNYLSESEFKNRTNKKATARFRWQSRVIPFGAMWSKNSSWALTNLANPTLLLTLQAYYQKQWQQQGLNGAYNDDTNKLIGANQFTVYSGGMIDELGLVVGSVGANQRYNELFSDFLTNLTRLDENSTIGLNISTANLYGRNGQSHLIEAGTLYLREHYLFPSTGFSGYAGIAKFWDNSALAHAEKSVIYQATTRYGRVEYFGNTQENWLQDQYSTLAIYYLNNHPSMSFFNQWNSSYLYGSNNTTNDNFWKSGIAKNLAYQPSHLLAIDLGTPPTRTPSHAKPIPLMLSTTTPEPADYTVIGDASMHTLLHNDLPNGKVRLFPTYTYFLYRSEHSIVKNGPDDMVLARDFSQGRVLYRTDFHGKNRKFYHADKLTIPLDPPMKPVNAKGEIGDYVDEIQIGGYQGLFLLY